MNKSWVPGAAPDAGSACGRMTMRPHIRAIADRRHREREELFLPKVRELIEASKREAGADISPLTPRQMALVIGFYRDHERRRQVFIRRLARTLTPEQRRRSRLDNPI